MTLERQIFYMAPLVLGAFLIPLLHTVYIFDNFTFIKWFAVHFIAILALISLFFYKEFYTAKLPKWIVYSLFMMALIFIGHLILGHTSIVSFPLADRLSLLTLTLCFCGFFHQKKISFQILLLPTLLSTFIVCSYGFYQMLSLTGVNDNFTSTFGNTNMTAQFLGFSILIQIFAKPWPKQTLSKMDWLRLSIFFLSIVYLTLLMCRSIFLGLACCTPFLFFKGTKPKAILLCVIAAVAVFVGVYIRAKPAEQLQRTKQFELQNTTANQRFEQWKSSFKMIQDQPFGMGPGAYEFGSIPYFIDTPLPPQENLVYRSPHNEFLRFAVEDGIIFTILFLVIGVWAFSRIRNTRLPDEKILFYTLGILFLSEMAFQFPLENAYPSFLFSIFAGRFLSLQPAMFKWNQNLKNWFCALMISVLLFLGGSMLYSKLLEANPQGNLDRIRIACEIFPDNWRPCMDYAKALTDRQEYKKADQILRKTLEKTPYNYIALQVWSVMAGRSGHLHEACLHLWIYDKLFQGKTAVHEQTIQNCSETANNFSGQNLNELYPKPLPKLLF